MEDTRREPSAQDASDVRAETQRIIDEEGVAQATAARESGLSPSALNAFLRDRYTGDNSEIARKLRLWIDSRAARLDAAALLPKVGWIPTAAARRILTAINYAQKTGRMALVIGAPGVGKTVTARHYQATNPNVWVATMAPDCRAPAVALQEIAEAVGVEQQAGRAARAMREALRRHLTRTAGVVIVDEAQHLGFQALEEIRALHDSAQIGIAMLGSHTLSGWASKGQPIEATAQLVSRLGMRARLMQIGDDDVALMLDAWHVRGDAERRFLADVAMRPGALRNVERTLEMAALSGSANGKINLGALKAARRMLEGAE
ncbi:AAA family ATPase [bacterium]|jgi:DNA transposition AAA+ family ATPase|nr:AAA family ATPase [bacterium]